jgi:hypothetical protein
VKILHEEYGSKSIYEWLELKLKENHKEKYGEDCTIMYGDFFVDKKVTKVTQK